MIELLLEAERDLSVGLLDQAERRYRQAAEADPRNAIAVVGLARVALERGDDATALELGRRALDIDPENVAGRRLVERLTEVHAARAAGVDGERRAEVAGAAEMEPTADLAAARQPWPAPSPAPPSTAPPSPTPDSAPTGGRRGLFGRLLRRDR